MKKLVLALVLAMAIAVVPATAKPHPHAHPPNSHKCTPHQAGYTVRGTLVSGSLTMVSRNHYDGTLTVHVVKANHHASTATGTDQTYTLSDAKIKLGKGEAATALIPGSRVKLNGKVTALGKKCDQTGFTPTVTIRNGSIKKPKA